MKSLKWGILVIAVLLAGLLVLTACGGDDDTPTKTETPTPTVVDTDGDGVPDDTDGCPNDANKTEPGECGCGIADTDTDSDGIADCNDDCPNDANNDADADGICGDADNCPDVANDDQADTDNDGLGDACDTCPNDADNDADGDGVCGDEDGCPNDANKTEPGECGCGIADTDSDNDGIADCNDNCPNTPNADQDPAACADDNDGDGVLNEADNCPDTPNADQADADGDGIGDACDEPEVKYVGTTWAYDVTYDCDVEKRETHNVITWDVEVTDEETVTVGDKDTDCYVISAEFSDRPIRQYNETSMLNAVIPVELHSAGITRSKVTGGVVQETFTLFVKSVGMTLNATRDYAYTEERPETLSVGDTWAYTTIIDMPDFLVHIEVPWTAEVVGTEEVTVPAGTYNCYKVEATADDGTINTYWWAVDEDFLCPVKWTYNYIFVGSETKELTSYTPAP